MGMSPRGFAFECIRVILPSYPRKLYISSANSEVWTALCDVSCSAFTQLIFSSVTDSGAKRFAVWIRQLAI